MKSDQKYTPKYWVAHNTKSDDVYITTAHKSMDAARRRAIVYLGEEIDEDYIGMVLIEIKLVDIGG